MLGNKRLQITKKEPLKGEDGHKIFSIRVKDEIIEKLDELSTKTNRSRNELIGIFLEYSIENCDIVWNMQAIKNSARLSGIFLLIFSFHKIFFRFSRQSLQREI